MIRIHQAGSARSRGPGFGIGVNVHGHAVFRQPIDDHARGNGVVGKIIHQDETAGQPVVLVRVVKECPVGSQRDPADLVKRKAGNADLVQGVYVDAVVDVVDARAGGLGGLLDQVVTGRIHGGLAHPDHHRLEPPIHVGQILRMNDHVTPAYIHFVFQLKRNGHGRVGLVQVAVVAGNGLYPGAVLARENQHFVSRPHHAGQHRSRVVPLLLAGSNDVLHRKAQVDQVAVGQELHVLQDVQHGLSVIPGRAAAPFHYVVA